jgi:hypothetical protein
MNVPESEFRPGQVIQFIKDCNYQIEDDEKRAIRKYLRSLHNATDTLFECSTVMRY